MNDRNNIGTTETNLDGDCSGIPPTNSIDRYDSNGPYSKDNAVAACKLCNSQKWVNHGDDFKAAQAVGKCILRDPESQKEHDALKEKHRAEIEAHAKKYGMTFAEAAFAVLPN